MADVAIETGGLRRGEWFWAMSQDAPYIDMRWERNGYETTEADAKARVIEARSSSGKPYGAAAVCVTMLGGAVGITNNAEAC